VFDKFNQQTQLPKQQKLHIKAIPVSQRQTFSKCEQPLQGHIVGDKLKSKTTVKVSCLDNISWNTYIRVNFSILMPVVITTRALSKGELINNENIKIIYKAKRQIRGAVFSELQSLNGVRLKRKLSVNKAVTHRDICYVCEDDKVTITANKGGLIIKASGIALSDGNIGSTVKVKNSRTQKIVVGTVFALKEVQVTF